MAALTEKQAWPVWVNVVVGAWLVVSGGLLGFTDQPAALWNSIIVGIVLAAFALWAYFGKQKWVHWVNVAAGVWLFLSPWILGFANAPKPLWNSLIFAVIAVADGLWGALMRE
jgi:hypothetical protein